MSNPKPNPNPNATRAKAKKRGKATAQPFRVLLVDNDQATRAALADSLGRQSRQMTLMQADTVSEARRYIDGGKVDLVLLEPAVSRGQGWALAEHVSRADSPTQTIVLSDAASFDNAVAALRAGAGDFLTKPVDPTELAERLQRAVERHRVAAKRHGQVRRLRRICKKLNVARDEVSQQVDILCNDLVGAYQELAGQMQQVVETSEFAALLRHELDLERLLHRMLEYLLEKAGPTNAAVFLPVNADEYTLGGYVNYDCADGSPELLLNHLADVAAPRVADDEQVIHVTDNDMMTDWLGDDAAYLTDCHMLAAPCWAEGEPLAVVVLFRDASQPFHGPVIDTVTAIAPMLGAYLAKIIRVHHRSMPDVEQDV